MPRKPNYRFERSERARAKAEKKAARLQARAERKGPQSNEDQTAGGAVDDTADAPAAETDSGNA